MIATSIRRCCLPILLILASGSLKAQWTNLQTSSNSYFDEPRFTSENIGYALIRPDNQTKKSLYRTSNGGKDWSKIVPDSLSSSSYHLVDAHFVNDNLGYLLVRDITSKKGNLLKTQNAGSQWTDITPDTLANDFYTGNHIYFANESDGHLFSYDGILLTNDGGTKWTQRAIRPDPFSNYVSINDFDFLDKDHAVIGAWDGTFFYKGMVFTTTNGGQSWDSLILPQYNSAIGKVDYAPDKTILALSNVSWQKAQRVYRSQNQGSTWDTLLLEFIADSMDQANDLEFFNYQTGYIATAKGYIYRTDDAGKTWKLEFKSEAGLSFLSASGKGLYSGGPSGVL